MSKVLAAVAVALTVLLGWQTVRAQAARQEADRAAADLVVERANALGLESTLATVRESFDELARENDSVTTALDTLIHELGALRTRNAALVSLSASAEGSSGSDSVVVIRVDTLDATPDTLRAMFDGPPVWSTITCTFPPQPNRARCDRTWRLLVGGRILFTELADGRVLAAVESNDEQVAFNIESAEWVPEREPSWLSKLWRNPYARYGTLAVALVSGCAMVC